MGLIDTVLEKLDGVQTARNKKRSVSCSVSPEAWEALLYIQDRKGLPYRAHIVRDLLNPSLIELANKVRAEEELR